MRVLFKLPSQPHRLTTERGYHLGVMEIGFPLRSFSASYFDLEHAKHSTSVSSTAILAMVEWIRGDLQ